MRNSKGFTLIELIIVIVVLGILAVTAAPQFIDFSGDARASATKGLKGALQGSSQTVYGRAAIEGKLAGTASSPGSTNGVDTVNGYPQASVGGIVEAAGLDGNDWDWKVGTTSSSAGVDEPGEGVIAIYIKDFDITGYNFLTPSSSTMSARCVVTYANATSANTAPKITVDVEGC